MKRVLIIFAREPLKGKVKTRLHGCLPEAACRNLYKAFVQDSVALARSIACEKRYIAYDTEGSEPRFLKSIAPDFGFFPQRGKHLGERIHRAFLFAARERADRTAIIGSDAPTLPSLYVRSAFLKLASHDVVVGPSLDGGYYLVGLTVPCKELFSRIGWGTNKVFMQTLARIRKMHLKAALLPPWYDVDDTRFLGFLRDALVRNRRGARKTREALDGRCHAV